MRPPAFGYLRSTSDATMQQAQRMRDELAAYAEREGYSLGEVFMEQEAAGPSAFAALIDALLRSKTRIVVVPSMCHFAHLPGLRAAMKDHIERETGARVIVIGEAAITYSESGRQSDE